MTSKPFDRKIAFFNSVGYTIAIAQPALVDPRLTTHVKYGPRHYPNAPWLFLLAPIVFFSTYLLMSRSTTRGKHLISSWLPMLLVAGPALLAFLPEFPHNGVFEWCFGTAFLSFLTTWLRYYSTDAVLPLRTGASRPARMEQLKATISLWQTLSISGAFAYLAFVVVWMNSLWKLTEFMVTSPSEQFFLRRIFALDVCVASLAVVVGPLNEAFRRTVRLIDALGEVV